MPLTPLKMPVSSNGGRSDSSDGSRLVNLFANILPDSSDGPKVVLYGTPGTTLFAALPTWPVLAMIEMGDKLYAVTASRLYRVEWYGAYVDLGAVSIAGGRVSIATNGIQIVFVDGTKGYYYSESDGLHELLGDGWYPATTVTFHDGYFIFNRAGTGQFFISNLLDITFDATMWATAEQAPDNTLCVISDKRLLWIFGKESGEVWIDTGNSLFPFERVPGTFIEVGILAPYTAAMIGGSIFWLGSDGCVYRTNGYNQQKVSSEAVEYSINTPLIEDAFAYTYSEEGHQFYVLTIPNKKITWVYDLATQLWHERSHFIFGRHISNCFCRLSKYGINFVGDFQNGNIYVMSMDSYTDDGAPIKHEAVFPQIHARGQGVTMYSLEIEMENDAQSLESPQVMMQWSDDGKKTWSKERWKPLGAIGEYRRRAKWGPLGLFIRRNVKFTITDPIKVVINGVFAEYG